MSDPIASASDTAMRRRDWIGFIVCFALAWLAVRFLDIGLFSSLVAVALGAFGTGFGISWMRSWHPVARTVALSVLGIGAFLLYRTLFGAGH